MAFSINNARSMSLLSFLFFPPPHPPGEWVGSKGLTHQQLPFSSFLTLLAFQLILQHSLHQYFIHCPAVFYLSALVTFSFLFSFPWPLRFPSPRPSFSLPFPLSLYLTLFHIPIVLACFPTQALFPLRPHFHLILFDRISHPTSCAFFLPSVCLSWLLSSLVFFRRVLETWGRGRAEEKSGEDTRLPRARGTAYPYQASTCLLDPPGHIALFT